MSYIQCTFYNVYNLCILEMVGDSTIIAYLPNPSGLLIDLQPEQSSRSPLQSIAQQNTRAARADGTLAENQ